MNINVAAHFKHQTKIAINTQNVGKVLTFALDGDYSSRGMPAFDKWLSADDVEAIRAYIIKRRADLAGGK